MVGFSAVCVRPLQDFSATLSSALIAAVAVRQRKRQVHTIEAARPAAPLDRAILETAGMSSLPNRTVGKATVLKFTLKCYRCNIVTVSIEIGHIRRLSEQFATQDADIADTADAVTDVRELLVLPF
jgi:hypothetical protein